MTPFEIRRQTAEKLAKPPKTGSEPRTQQPIETCVIPATLKGRLETIRARCEQSVAAREAKEAGGSGVDL